jgi:hypothetical protein
MLIEQLNNYFADELRSRPLLHVLVMRAARGTTPASNKKDAKFNANDVKDVPRERT